MGEFKRMAKYQPELQKLAHMMETLSHAHKLLQAEGKEPQTLREWIAFLRKYSIHVNETDLHLDSRVSWADLMEMCKSQELTFTGDFTGFNRNKTKVVRLCDHCGATGASKKCSRCGIKYCS